LARRWKIDKNVPIPPRRKGGRYLRKDASIGLYTKADTMEIGDSIGGLSLSQANNVQSYYGSGVTTKREKKFVRRMEDNGSHRIWRVW
jgi:hypothetical protein